jgi:hypothetical protein
MLELHGDRITSMTSYLDVATLFPRSGPPMPLTTQNAALQRLAAPAKKSSPAPMSFPDNHSLCL